MHPLNNSLGRTAAGRFVAWLVGFAAVLSITGCGTPYATVSNAQGEPVMLLGYDPVAYFTQQQPVRGNPALKVNLQQRTYYFANEEHLRLFQANPSRYEPQYAGFCASGAAFAIKLGSDPTAWQIKAGRLFIFGDIVGQTAWQLDPDWNIRHADALWPQAQNRGWRVQSLLRYANKVPHYLSGAQIREQFAQQNPGKAWPSYNPGGMVDNLFLKPPGWRAAEGFGQPALGYPP